MNRRKKILTIGKRGLAFVIAAGLILGNAVPTSAEKATKEESVYVSADAAGSVTEVTIKEVITKEGKEETQPQKTTEKELPVGVEFSYLLDGQEIVPSELAGKSGRVEIHVSYENYSKVTKKIKGKNESLYTPFFMITGVVLPTEKFKNVKVNHGKIISEGANQIVIGFGAPALADSLNIEDKEKRKKFKDKIPEAFTITADVTEFELENTITYASAGILSELDIEDSTSFDDLENKIDTLTDSSTELVKGAGKLSKATETFRELFQKYVKGEKEITKGIAGLHSGLGKLMKGLGGYTTGVDSLAKGVTSYINGAKQLSEGVQAIYRSAKDMPAGYQAFSEGIKSYTTAVDNLAKKENTEILTNRTVTVTNDIQSLNTKLKELDNTYGEYTEIIEELKAQAELETDETKKQSILSYANQLKTLADKQELAVQELVDKTGEEGSVKKEASQLQTDVGQLVTGLAAVADASQTLRASSDTISTGIRSVAAGMSSLNEGASSLNASNETLLAGAKKLQTSGKTIISSGKKITSASSKLKKGSKTVSKSASKLAEGAGKLESGTESLYKGIKQFDKKGIQKISETYKNDFKEIKERLLALVDISKEYNNFSGTENMDGEVKFIIETEKIIKKVS